MIKHVVFFKFKPETTVGERAAVLQELRDLPAQIPSVRSFEVGEDVINSARSWDAVLIATYKDVAALDAYSSHEAHVPVALRLRGLCQAIGSVDFEC